MKAKGKKTRLQLLHQYYNYTGFYAFLASSLKKALPPILAVVIGVVLLDLFVVDLREVFTDMVATFSTGSVLSVFFASESFIGAIPPEIFIAWASKTAAPLLFLTVLGVLSYFGGVVSYFLGRAMLRIPAVYKRVEGHMSKHVRNTRKWGGVLIAVGALLPLPFSVASMAAGVIDYRFRNFLLYGLLRIVRFYIYAIAVFNLL